jgi:hypothetical protein
MSGSKMVYGISLTLSAQLAASSEQPVDKILKDLAAAAPLPTRHSQREALTEAPAALAAADLVYLRKGGQLQPLAQPYSGPYKVMEKGPRYLGLDIGGKHTAVTVDRLKPHTGGAAATLAAPPRRGRPPKEQPATPATCARSASPGLPATTGARPSRQRRAPNR